MDGTNFMNTLAMNQFGELKYTKGRRTKRELRNKFPLSRWGKILIREKIMRRDYDDYDGKDYDDDDTTKPTEQTHKETNVTTSTEETSETSVTNAKNTDEIEIMTTSTPETTEIVTETTTTKTKRTKKKKILRYGIKRYRTSRRYELNSFGLSAFLILCICYGQLDKRGHYV